MVWASLFGSIIGFLVCYQTLVKMHQSNDRIRMRICMLNSMSLAFIFALLVEFTSGSKSLAVVLPMVTVCIPMVLMMSPFNILDIVETAIANLMSVTMSVMLIGMVSPDVIWTIECILVVVEVTLYFTVIRRHGALHNISLG